MSLSSNAEASGTLLSCADAAVQAVALLQAAFAGQGSSCALHSTATIAAGPENSPGLPAAAGAASSADSGPPKGSEPVSSDPAVGLCPATTPSSPAGAALQPTPAAAAAAGVAVAEASPDSACKEPASRVAASIEQAADEPTEPAASLPSDPASADVVGDSCDAPLCHGSQAAGEPAASGEVVYASTSVLSAGSPLQAGHPSQAVASALEPVLGGDSNPAMDPPEVSDAQAVAAGASQQDTIQPLCLAPPEASAELHAAAEGVLASSAVAELAVAASVRTGTSSTPQQGSRAASANSGSWLLPPRDEEADVVVAGAATATASDSLARPVAQAAACKGDAGAAVEAGAVQVFGTPASPIAANTAQYSAGGTCGVEDSASGVTEAGIVLARLVARFDVEASPAGDSAQEVEVTCMEADQRAAACIEPGRCAPQQRLCTLSHMVTPAAPLYLPASTTRKSIRFRIDCVLQ